jgi:phospholipid transport system substrate-binding protein
LTVLALSAPAALVVTLPTPAAAAADSAAMTAFKSRHQAVVKLVKAGAGEKKLEKEVDQLLDYKWLAQAALGGESKYAGACGAKCGEFDGLLTQLIRENYLRLVRKANKHEVVYVGEKTGKSGAVKIDTQITVTKNGRDQVVKVSYVMHQIGGQWQVRDMITDGVSIAKTYRFEFKKVLAKDGIDGILARLRTKLDEIGRA